MQFCGCVSSLTALMSAAATAELRLLLRAVCHGGYSELKLTIRIMVNKLNLL